MPLAKSSIGRTVDGADEASSERLHGVRAWLAGLPNGRGLSERDWKARHRWIMVVVWLHVPALTVFALVRHDAWITGATFPSFEPSHVMLEVLPLVAFAVLGSWPNASRRLRSLAASLALITGSALLTHFSGGYIEAHFHFFVVLGVIALYHDAVPFVVSIVYVALHHGVAGTIDPRSVYNHEAAWAHPWRWALVHAAFVLSLAAVEVFHWRSTQDAHDRTALVMRSAGDGIIGVDGRGTVTFANGAAARMVGHEDEDLTGRPAEAVFTRALSRVLGEAGKPQAVTEGGRREESNVAVQAADGSIRWLDLALDPVRHRDQDDGCVVVLRDVTERRDAERRLMEAQQMASLASWSWDSDRKESLQWSAGAARLLGYAPGADALAHPLRMVHPDDRARVAHQLQGAAAGAAVNLSCRILDAAGRERTFHVQGRPGIGDDGNVGALRLSGTIQDITDRERMAELEAEAARQRTEVDRLQRQGDFRNGIINNLAHELNTPLTPLRVQLHLLSRGATGLDQGQRRAIGVIERNMQRFEKLVGDMLETARIQNNRVRLERRTHNLADLAGEAMQAFEAEADRRGIHLVYSGQDPLLADVDGNRMTKVLHSLVSNAMKFVPDGGHVEVAGSEEGGFVSMTVDDSGPGVPGDASEALFQPFSQIDSRGRAETATGTGLGLFISRGLVERHGGRIWCEPKGALGGAHFGFTVPVSGPADDDDLAAVLPGRSLPDAGLVR